MPLFIPKRVVYLFLSIVHYERCFFMGLCCSIFYFRAASIPNQVMQRTARSRMMHFMSVCHSPVQCIESFTGLAVADLVSR
jgi:hypothetical protein